MSTLYFLSISSLFWTDEVSTIYTPVGSSQSPPSLSTCKLFSEPSLKDSTSPSIYKLLDAHSSRTCSLVSRSEEHTSELQSRFDLVCRLLLEKKKTTIKRDQQLMQWRHHVGGSAAAHAN